MYLTAHRVQSPNGEEGINAWMHVHGDIVWPSQLWDILCLVETNPGEPAGQSWALKPGGNSVLAYLDVLAPDGTPRAEIVAALDHLYRFPPENTPVAIHVGSVALRMSVNLGRISNWTTDVEDLSRAVENLMRAQVRLRAGRPSSKVA